MHPRTRSLTSAPHPRPPHMHAPRHAHTHQPQVSCHTSPRPPRHHPATHIHTPANTQRAHTHNVRTHKMHTVTHPLTSHSSHPTFPQSLHGRGFITQIFRHLTPGGKAATSSSPSCSPHLARQTTALQILILPRSIFVAEGLLDSRNLFARPSSSPTTKHDFSASVSNTLADADKLLSSQFAKFVYGTLLVLVLARINAIFEFTAATSSKDLQAAVVVVRALVRRGL